MAIAPPQVRAAEFREALYNRVLVADGAMATMLFAKGVLPNRCLEELNLSLPALIRDVHREYMRAGAQILETNTFGANRARLAAHGLGAKVRQINQAAVRIAREASGGEAFVAGAVGPLAMEPRGSATTEHAREMFREQIGALVAAGVDVLIFETFQDLDELRLALEVGRELAGQETVLVAQVAAGDAFDTFREMAELPADVIGLNCGSGPKALLDALKAMGSCVVDRPLSAMPTAGLPSQVNGCLVYPCSPAYVAECARLMVEAGAKIVGGCCGTTPEHIEAIAEAIEGVTPAPRVAMSVREIETPLRTLPPISQRSDLGARLSAGEFVVMVEILPPRGLFGPELRWVQQCGRLVVVPELPPPRLSASAVCHMLQAQAGADPVLMPHLNGQAGSTGASLLSAFALGIRNILYRETDTSAVRIADEWNRSHALGEGAVLVGLEGFSAVPGCDFLVTPPIFDAAALGAVKSAGVPVIATVRPLESYRDAAYAANELGLAVPQEALDRMRQANDDDARGEGIAMARELVAQLRPLVAGVRLLATGGNSAAALEVARSIAP